MDESDILYIHNRIISGCVVVDINDTIYIVKDPTPIEKQISQHEYNKAYAAYLLDSVPTTNELEGVLCERHVWTLQNDSELDRLVALLESHPNNDKLQNKIDRLKNKKYSLISRSAEHLAILSKYKKLLWLCTYDINGNRMWGRWDEFLKEDEFIINKILQDVFFNDKITESNLRKLARSEMWRSIWLAGVKAGNLFGKPMCEMSDLQRAVVSWSIMYDNIYEHPECPPDHVISDDALLDIWLKQESDKRKNKQSEHSFTKDLNSVMKHNEICLVVGSPEEAKKVYEMNDKSVAGTIKQRERFLQDHRGSKVREADLPDVKLDINLRRARIEKEAIKRRAK